jgi:hypothetical protein
MDGGVEFRFATSLKENEHEQQLPQARCSITDFHPNAKRRTEARE